MAFKGSPKETLIAKSFFEKILPVEVSKLMQVQLPIELIPIGKVVKIVTPSLLDVILSANAIEVLS